jgi:translation elongation factor EF-Ts
VKKIALERALLEQPYLVDSTKTVAEAVKATIAAVGENVQVGVKLWSCQCVLRVGVGVGEEGGVGP